MFLLPLRSAAAVLLTLAVSVRPASAQITTGTITGVIVDAQGGVIPGATVVIRSESQGIKTAVVVTNNDGIYVAPSLATDTYTLEVSASNFKTLTRKGVKVSGGDRIAVDKLVLEVGGKTETVLVQADEAVVQTASAERSSVLQTVDLENLPIFSHDFLQFVGVQPGVNAAALGTGAQEGRLGGGGQDNVTINGVSAMDTGNNGLMGGLNLPVDTISEVKVVTSGAAAEYGRSSGLQISAVTKSGTNKFRFSTYGYDRNSNWNSNSWANQKNGRPKGVSKSSDFGFIVGGPVGAPGGNNKLFFSYSQEFRPRTVGNGFTDFRLPTAAERKGDFSGTLDNNGALYNLIYDPSTGLPKSACSATIQTACFRDGGALGRIPIAKLYGPGLALLNQYPLPNVTQVAGQSYNYEAVAPIQKQLGYTPAIRMDYQMSPSLRLSGMWNGSSARVLPAIGSLPGFNDTLQKFPLSLNTSGTVDYSFSPTTFVELTYGLNQNRLGSPPVSSFSNRDTVVCPPDLAAAVSNCTLGGIAYLFPGAGVMDPRYYEYKALQAIGTPFFDNGRILLPPQLSWAASGTSSRITGPPPSLNFPGFMNINRTQQVSVSVTKVVGTHSPKIGLQVEHSYKAQNFNSALTSQGALNFGPDTNNLLDAGYPFANVALGVFSSYAQQSRFIEGSFLYTSTEWYLQDNWKVNRRVTFDYGVRFAHDQPQYDQFAQTANFFPDRWTRAAAPVLYVPGCAGASPCTDENRQASDPRSGALLGPGTSSLIGQAVVGTGDVANGMVQAGNGIAKTGYTWPALAIAPRFGVAYNVGGREKLVLRGSVGLYFDRPDGNTVFGTVANPPTATGLTQQWGRLSDLSGNPFGFGPVPTVRVFYYNSKLPSDTQWNIGAQVALPWQSSVDLSYVGHHAFNVLGGQQAGNAVDINAIDLGTTTAASGQDPTQAPGTALPNNLLRKYSGYSNILIQWGRFHRTYHSLQTSFHRRFRGGISADLAWTWSISDRGNTGLPSPQLRLTHNDDGTFTVRNDQATAERLFGDQGTTSHVLIAKFVWTLPRLNPKDGVRRALGVVVNDWQLSGIFRADSGAPYDVTYTYDTGGGVNLTGSPDYNARVLINGGLGSGCASNQYAQFNTATVKGPLPGSLGLESGRNLLHSCKNHQIDLAIQRSFKLPHGLQLQFRMDMYNALNAVIYTGRVTTVQLTSPSNQAVLNPQYLSTGKVDPNRLLPENAGFGATAAAAARSMQAQVRLKF